MFVSYNVTALLLVISVLIRTSAGDPATCSGACPRAYRCNPYYNGPLVWSIVDGTCEVFKTSCIFSSRNCDRKNQCLDVLEATTQQECQQYCAQCNGQPVVPVCGVHFYFAEDGSNAEERMTFNNKCEMLKYSCENSKSFLSHSAGQCN